MTPADTLPPLEHVNPGLAARTAWCLCGIVDDQGEGTCGNCGLRIMTEDDETRVLPPGSGATS